MRDRTWFLVLDCTSRAGSRGSKFPCFEPAGRFGRALENVALRTP
jgi:hypothetical protein